MTGSVPPRNAPQAWYAPWNDTIHRSDKEPWAGWWNNHQGAGDQWYDDFYKDAEHFTYRQPLTTALVEFGEMEGCAVPDNHALMVRQLATRQFGGNGKSYDLQDHQEILASYDRFLDRWGFRKAFPTAHDLFSSIGNKCYESWQQYLENARICDALDFAVISGWESTAIENHSGIVDNLRNFKGNPELIASTLRPLRLVVKQHKLCYATGEEGTFDLYLLNDTNRAATGQIEFVMKDPAGKETTLASWPTPAWKEDQFSYSIQTAFKTSPLAKEGLYHFRLLLRGHNAASAEREIWVADANPSSDRTVSIGISGIMPSIRKQLQSLTGIAVSEFQQNEHYDLIIASGVVRGSRFDRQVGDETGLEARPAKGTAVEPQVPGHIAEEALAALKSGTPLLAIVPDDALADGVAQQLASVGLFTYSGQVGDTRAPWMGNWLFVRDHPTFAHLPTDRALSVHYQAHGKQSNGLLIERATGAADPEIIMGYSRDHDRNIGAASFLCQKDNMRVLVHRAPSFSDPLQQRWLANTLRYLTQPHQERNS